MKWRSVICSLLAPILFLGSVGHVLPAQTAAMTAPESAPAKPPKPQFFAGLVIEAAADHVKVSRTLVGRPAETHVFAINGKTKTPRGGVKLKMRVTVRYEHSPERDLALEIQVRPANHTQKPS